MTELIPAAGFTEHSCELSLLRGLRAIGRNLAQTSECYMLKDSLIADIVESADRFRLSRRDIHAHPELGFEVTRTADIVAARLREWGYRVETGIGCTGVVAQLKNGGGIRSIGLRADMDALPIIENTA